MNTPVWTVTLLTLRRFALGPNGDITLPDKRLQVREQGFDDSPLSSRRQGL
jgi:hypothetical protein